MTSRKETNISKCEIKRKANMLQCIFPKQHITKVDEAVFSAAF